MPDIKVQHFSGDFASPGGSFTVTAPAGGSQAFVLPSNVRHHTGGEATTGTNDLRNYDLSLGLEYGGAGTSVSVTIASSTRTMRVAGMLVECTAPAGVDGFYVRDRRKVTLTTSGNSASFTPSGISTAADCIPFITGIVRPDNQRSYQNTSVAATINTSTGQVTITAGDASANIDVYVTTVEFTGSNWKVYHGSATGYADSGTITLDGSVSAWGKAAIFHSYFVGTPTADPSNATCLAKFTPNAALNKVDWAHNANGSGEPDAIYAVHVLEGTNLAVSRFQPSGDSAGTLAVDISSAGLDGTEDALTIISATDGRTGNQLTGAARNANLTSTTNVNLWTGRSSSGATHELQVVEFLTASGGVSGSGDLTLPAFTMSGSGATGDITGAGAMTLPALTLSGSGAVSISGSGNLTLPAFTVAATVGEQAAAVSGSGALTLPAFTASGSGAQTSPAVSGTASMTLPAFIMRAGGIVENYDKVISGEGSISRKGDFDITLSLPNNLITRFANHENTNRVTTFFRELRVTGSVSNDGTIEFTTDPIPADLFSVEIAQDFWLDELVVEAPTAEAVPTISGTPSVGRQLNASVGSWTGFGVSEYAFQWKRNGSPISGATRQNYVVTADDDGAQITVSVTATNPAGGTTATSQPVPVNFTGPVLVVTPQITGTARIGQTLTCSTGTWSGGGITYAYAWKRNGVAISGATTSNYTLVPADDQRTITCTVTATNTGGAQSATAPGVTVTYAAPTLAGSIADQTFEQNSGIKYVSYAGVFSGSNLSFALTSSQTGLTVDTANQRIAINTGSTGALAGSVVTLQASNSGGNASAAFQLTVEADQGVEDTEYDAAIGLSPLVLLDDENGVFRLNGSSLTYAWDLFENEVATAPADMAMVIDKDGDLKWPMHNLDPRAGSGATTFTLTLEAGRQHTVTFAGTGSVTLSGGATATLNGGGASVVTAANIVPTGNVSVSLTGTIDQFHAYRSDAGGMQSIGPAGNPTYLEAPNGPRFTLGRAYGAAEVGGYVGIPHLEAATNEMPYPNPQASWGSPWNDTSATSQPDNLELFGVADWVGRRVISGGEDWHRIDTQGGSPLLSLTAGVPVAFSVVYDPGTSGKVMFQVRDSATTNTCRLGGPISNVEEVLSETGAFTNATDVGYGGGRVLYCTFTPSVTGDYEVGFGPFSTTSGEYATLAFVQFERRAVPTSLMPFGSRLASAPTLAYAGTGLPDDGVTVMIEAVTVLPDADTSTRTLASLDDGDANDQISVLIDAGNDQVGATITSGGSQTASLAAASASPLRTAITYTANDASLTADSATLDRDTTVTLPSPTIIRLGHDVSGQYLNGYIKKFGMWPGHINGSDLQSLVDTGMPGTSPTVPTKPSSITAPEVTGTPIATGTLTCSQGAWGGTIPQTYAYQWRRNQVPISGETSSSYVARNPEDVGQSITCEVTAANSVGTASAVSNAVVIADPSEIPEPVNTTRPLITGSSAVGSTLSCSTGTWTGMDESYTVTTGNVEGLYWHPTTLSTPEASRIGWLPPDDLDGLSVEVVRVTNRNASGAGSLDAAVNGSSARDNSKYTVVVFDVAGRINFGGTALTIQNARRLIVAGETAPGHVELWDTTLRLVGCQRTIVRHVASRGNPSTSDENDALQMRSNTLCTLQNVSFANSRDEQTSYETSSPVNSYCALLDCLVAFPLGAGGKDHRFGNFIRFPNGPVAIARSFMMGGRRGYPRISDPCYFQYYNNLVVAGETDEASAIVHDGEYGSQVRADWFDNEYVWFTRDLMNLRANGVDTRIYESGVLVRTSYTATPQSVVRESAGNITYVNSMQYVPAFQLIDKSVTSVRDFVKTHAGARPADRDTTDALAVSEAMTTTSVSGAEGALVTRNAPVNNAPASVSQTFSASLNWSGSTNGIANALLELDSLHIALGGVSQFGTQEITVTPSYAYQWYRNDSAISGATDSTYTTTSTDANTAITCRVTATNAAGSTVAASSNSVQVTVQSGDFAKMSYVPAKAMTASSKWAGSFVGDIGWSALLSGAQIVEMDDIGAHQPFNQYTVPEYNGGTTISDVMSCRPRPEGTISVGGPLVFGVPMFSGRVRMRNRFPHFTRGNMVFAGHMAPAPGIEFYGQQFFVAGQNMWLDGFACRPDRQAESESVARNVDGLAIRSYEAGSRDLGNTNAPTQDVVISHVSVAGSADEGITFKPLNGNEVRRVTLREWIMFQPLDNPGRDADERPHTLAMYFQKGSFLNDAVNGAIIGHRERGPKVEGGHLGVGVSVAINGVLTMCFNDGGSMRSDLARNRGSVRQSGMNVNLYDYADGTLNISATRCVGWWPADRFFFDHASGNSPTAGYVGSFGRGRSMGSDGPGNYQVNRHESDCFMRDYSLNDPLFASQPARTFSSIPWWNNLTDATTEVVSKNKSWDPNNVSGNLNDVERYVSKYSGKFPANRDALDELAWDIAFDPDQDRLLPRLDRLPGPNGTSWENYNYPYTVRTTPHNYPDDPWEIVGNVPRIFLWYEENYRKPAGCVPLFDDNA